MFLFEFSEVLLPLRLLYNLFEVFFGMYCYNSYCNGSQSFPDCAFSFDTVICSFNQTVLIF